MKLTALTAALGLLLLLVVIGPGAVEARRHHNHGDPGKNEQRRRERQEEAEEAEQWSAAPEDVGDVVIDWDQEDNYNNNNNQPLVHSQVDKLLPPLYPSTDGFLEEDTVLRKPNKGHGGKKKKKNHHHHPVDESADSVSKDQWKRITNYHKSDDDGCANLKCRRRQVCLVDVETGEAECVHRRVLRMKRKMKKAESLAKKEKRKAEKRLQESESDYFISEDDESAEERRMKEHMENIKNSPEYREKEELMYASQPKSAFDYVDRSASKKSEVHVRKANSALNTKPDKACTKQDMDEMGRRLLDWFKLLMEDSEKDRDAHHKSKRNSKKKELRDDDECICQAPVSWEFQQLDGDSSSQLTAEELRDIEDNGYEHCVRPFIDVCDHNHDLQLSQKEWCCCFADILPPCLGAQRRIPTEERNGRSQVLVGAFVPTCDEDGFFEREQCHGSTGQCWCVDRNGHEIHSTRRQGAADCDRYTERYIQENV